MKRRISLILCALTVLVCVLSLGTAAVTYEPDGDGTYTVELELQPNSEYIMVVLRGEYDQTNYIEAYYKAEDSEIIYFEQKVSDDNGNVVFGPFVPFGYYDATVILGGTDLEEPYFAGYLSSEGVSNSASIEVSGIEESYTVKGTGTEDIVIDTIETVIYDSFGYPSLVEQDVTVDIENYTDGVMLRDGAVVIKNNAKAQHFNVVVSAGDAEKSILVEVLRENSVHNRLEVYADEDCTQIIDSIEFYAVAENIPEITVYAKTYDQYGEEIEDDYTYTYGGEQVESTFTPGFRIDSLVVASTLAPVRKEIVVVVNELPDYKDSALEFYNLINSCRELYFAEKNISTNGKDVYPEETWTTKGAVDTFLSEINKAQTALNRYGESGYSDGDYTDEITTLTKALATYNSSFKAGTRKDIESILIQEKERIILVGGTIEITADINPKVTTDEITWTSSDTGILNITKKSGNTVTLKGMNGGVATVTATTKTGLTATAEVTVIDKATYIALTTSATSATFRGDKVVITAKISPGDCNDVITWSFKQNIIDLEYNEYIDGDYRVIEATVIPKANGVTDITVKAQYGGTSLTKSIKGFESIMPDWKTAMTPVASVASGSILSGTTVTLTSDADAAIYYTLDGTTPSKTSGRLYRGPIAIGQNLTLKAIAVGDELYDSEIATYEYKVVASSVKVSSAVARRGDYVDIKVSADDFANVKNAVINIVFDNTVLDLADVEYVCKYVDEDNCTSAEPQVSIALNNKEEGFSYSGDVAVLTFRVREEAVRGKSYVSLTAAAVELMDGSAYDAAPFDGFVDVNDYILGDANNDGVVGLADVLIIKQYAAGKESAVKNILLEAADVDADGIVDEDDAVLVSKYCVGWNVTFGKEPIDNLRIVSRWDINQDDEGYFRIYYDLLNPFIGEYEMDVPSQRFEKKAKNLGSGLTEQTFVKVSNGFVDDEQVNLKLHGEPEAEYSIDKANLVWIAEVDEAEGTFVVVPYNDILTSANEVKAYVESLDENNEAYAVKDVYGHAIEGNVVAFDKYTAVSTIKYDAYNNDMWRYGTFGASTMSAVAKAGKDLVCWNDHALTGKDNDQETTRYSEFVKAYISVDHNVNEGEMQRAEYVVVVVNGNEDTVLYE